MRKKKSNFDGRYSAQLVESDENNLTLSFTEGTHDSEGNYFEKIAVIKVYNGDIETILSEYRKINAKRFQRASERIEKLKRIMET